MINQATSISTRRLGYESCFASQIEWQRPRLTVGEVSAVLTLSAAAFRVSVKNKRAASLRLPGSLEEVEESIGHKGPLGSCGRCAVRAKPLRLSSLLRPP